MCVCVCVWQLLRVTGISELPVWYNAGAVEYGFANKETLFIVQLLLMGFELLLICNIMCVAVYSFVLFL